MCYIMGLSVSAFIPVPRRIWFRGRTTGCSHSGIGIRSVTGARPLHCPSGKLLGTGLDCSSLHRLFLYSCLWMAYGLCTRSRPCRICIFNPPSYAGIGPLPSVTGQSRRSQGDRHVTGTQTARTCTSFFRRSGRTAAGYDCLVPGIVEETLYETDCHVMARMVRY